MKLFKFFLPILCALCLCGCAKEPPAPAPEETPPPVEAEALPAAAEAEPVRPALPMITQEESLRMANLMSVNRALVDGDTLYTFDFDEDYAPVLAAYTITETGLTARAELVKDCVPEYLTLYDGRLYFVSDGAIRSLKPDGTALKTLVENVSGDLQITDGSLWYRDGEGRFCRAQTDGRKAEVVINRLCFYPCVLGDVVLYQDDADGEKLHLYSLSDGTDGRLTDLPVYEYVIIGNALYFTTMTENGLRPAKLGADGIVEVYAGFDTEAPVRFSFFGGTWTASGAALDRLASGAPPESTGDTYETTEYTSASFELRARNNPDARIREFVLYTADGEWVFLGGTDNN